VRGSATAAAQPRAQLRENIVHVSSPVCCSEAHSGKESFTPHGVGLVTIHGRPDLCLCTS
jgi:hypothetical protein